MRVGTAGGEFEEGMAWQKIDCNDCGEVDCSGVQAACCVGVFGEELGGVWSGFMRGGGRMIFRLGVGGFGVKGCGTCRFNDVAERRLGWLREW